MNIRGKDSFPLLYGKKGKTMGEMLRDAYIRLMLEDELKTNFKPRKENLNGII